ncbi:thioesterase family protein [Microbacterium elymi]|uniref:Thioesterase family protein n=1 Tax=Microbacterium elymi TaxID=2909587 RepID=A0ABY5NLK6_9MICO|nr:thioesterase family protein [Microbacterium elymi]UUT36045.1 thioesterase family protein [Microbacterium elymi]
MTAYFERLGPTSFRATDHTRGAWDPTQMHVAPTIGLLAHAIESDRDARRDDGLLLTRLSVDILGTMPVGTLEVAVRVLRPGRTIELVEATLAHDGRTALIARAWLEQGTTPVQCSGARCRRSPARTSWRHSIPRRAGPAPSRARSRRGGGWSSRAVGRYGCGSGCRCSTTSR